MAGYYLKEMTVPIPQNDGRVVIRRGKTVEYELDRTYSQERQDTRVTRRVIGKVDPVNPGRMFPNETYFQLLPGNEVPEEVRDEFLRGCEIKRRMQEIRRSPEEIIEGVVNGLSELRAGTAGTTLTGSGGTGRDRSRSAGGPDRYCPPGRTACSNPRRTAHTRSLQRQRSAVHPSAHNRSPSRRRGAPPGTAPLRRLSFVHR